MLERLVILVVAAVAFTLATLAIRAWSGSRTRKLQASDGALMLETLGTTPDGRRTIVTFSTPSCAACHTVQAPAVERVQQQLGSVRVVKIDAARQPHVARTFGVLTVPSTVVLDPEGKVAAVNHGFAPAQRLMEQLQRA